MLNFYDVLRRINLWLFKKDQADLSDEVLHEAPRPDDASSPLAPEKFSEQAFSEVLPAESVPSLPPSAHFLGTSNFVMRESIIKAFRAASGWQGVVRAIGGCSSAFGLYSYESLPKPQGLKSFVVIDFVINDSQALRAGLADLDDLLQNLRDLVFALRADGHIPVLLVLPAQEFFATPNTLEQAQIAFAKEVGILHWNLAGAFRDACASGLPRGAFMRDSAHMTPEACVLAGERLSACLGAIAAASCGQQEHAMQARSFRKLAAQDVAEGRETFTMSNSLTSTSLLRIEAGDALSLPVPEGEALAALMLNMGASGSVTAFANGETEVSKRLVMYWNGEKPEIYSLILADLFQAVEGRGAGVTLSLKPQDYPVSEGMLHGRNPLPERYGTLEIEGFLLRSARPEPRKQLRETFADLPLDLALFPEAADFATALSALAKDFEAKRAEATAG